MAKERLPKTRWGAFGVHLAISAAIFVLLLILIVRWFFPGALFLAAGGWEGIRIIAGVDVVLGPLLTLAIYNAAKPRRELYRDLAIIGTIQFASLFAGMYVVYNQRPVAATWVLNEFHVSKIGDYHDAGLTGKDLDHLSPLTTVVNYVDLPESRTEAQKIVINYALSGELMQVRTDLTKALPRERGHLEKIMGPSVATEDDADCLPVRVASRFGEFHLCYDWVAQRFARIDEPAHKLESGEKNEM